MKSIYIFGLGAIGSNLLLQLSKKYPEFQFTGIDYDKVEERNINTQAYFIPHINMAKAMAMNVVLGMNLRKFNYKAINVKIETEEQLSMIMVNETNPAETLYIDCFDNADARRKFRARTQEVLHVGFSPQYTAEILWNDTYTAPNDIPEEQNDICEMSEAIPFINFVVSLACMTISDFIENKIKRNALVLNKNQIKYI